MSTRSSSSSNLIPPFSDPESVIRNRRRNLSDPSLLLDFEEINMNSNNVQGPPPAYPPAQNHNGPPGLNLQMPALDLRTMEELWQPTMNGRGRPIAPVNIQATDLGLKNHMIQQVQYSCQVTDDALRVYLFPYSLTHHATAWFDRLPKNSIHTFQEMATKFLSKYFSPSVVAKLRNDTSNFRQLSDESLFEAWERYKHLIDRCPNHYMLPVTQIDTFYNGLTLRHRDTINDAAGGTFMKRGESSSSTTSSSSEIAALAQQMIKMRKDMLQMYRSNHQVNSVTPSCESCEMRKALQERPQGALPSNTILNPREELKAITTRSGIVLAEPSVPLPPLSSSSKEVERDPETITDQYPPSSSYFGLPRRNPHQPPIPYPSRLNKEKLQDKSDIQVHKFLQMFKKLHFNISLAEALALMPKYAKMLKDLLSDKEKLLGLENTSLTKNCSAVLLKKLPKKLRDPRKFLIPCDFFELEECMALADLGIAEDVYVQEDRLEDQRNAAPTVLCRFIDSSPKIDINIIDPILERFTDEPALVYSFLSEDDDDDLFDFKSDNKEWKKLLYGDLFDNTHSENEKDKDLEIKCLINDMDDDFFPLLPISDSTLLEESSEIATLISSPFGNEDKVFNPGILILGGTQIFHEESKDKDLKMNSSTEALLILVENNFLSHSSDRELLFFLESTVIETLLSFSS
ncbi:reverse transcriptase domain-containing protein [Tanacetum coccineum]